MSRFIQNGNTQVLASLLMWMGISLAMSLTISFILPFPWSLAAVIGILLLLDFCLIRKVSRRMRNGYNASSIFDSLLSLFSSSDGRRGAANKGALKYNCISCGVQHNQGSCPICGSKLMIGKHRYWKQKEEIDLVRSIQLCDDLHSSSSFGGLICGISSKCSDKGRFTNSNYADPVVCTLDQDNRGYNVMKLSYILATCNY